MRDRQIYKVLFSYSINGLKNPEVNNVLADIIKHEIVHKIVQNKYSAL